MQTVPAYRPGRGNVTPGRRRTQKFSTPFRQVSAAPAAMERTGGRMGDGCTPRRFSWSFTVRFAVSGWWPWI